MKEMTHRAFILKYQEFTIQLSYRYLLCRCRARVEGKSQSTHVVELFSDSDFSHRLTNNSQRGVGA